MIITEEIKYVGVTDRNIDLFEGQYKVPYGITYNSYVILDERIAVMDSVDAAFGGEWMSNLGSVLGDREPDYLVVHHMEPDHSANIMTFLAKYPGAKVVSSAKAFGMMKNFFGEDLSPRGIIVSEGDTLELGKHKLTFLGAPMVHWPEVIVSYDSTEGVLFSADGFGRFGQTSDSTPWADEARRYYIGIVGKYGAQVSALLKKASALDIRIICPLHGPVLKENAKYCIDLYSKWSSYTPEERGVTVAYASVYGNTERAALELAGSLREAGQTVAVYDLNRCDLSLAVADAFRYDRLVLASTTYNGEVFPSMREYLAKLTERNFSRRTVGIIENGSWAPMAAKVIRASLERCKELTYTDVTVKINSALSDESRAQLEALKNELISK